MLSRFSELLVGDTELTKDKQRLLSLVLLLAAIVFAWIPHERSWLLFRIWKRTFLEDGFFPDFITAIMGVMIVLPLYLRNILKWEHTSVYSILSAAINITLVATLCKIVIGNGFSASLLSYLLLFAIFLSWLGMRPVAGLAWVAVLVIGIFGLIIRNYAMGIHGYLFVLCSFIGLLLQSEMKPRDVMLELSNEFRGPNRARMTSSSRWPGK